MDPGGQSLHLATLADPIQCFCSGLYSSSVCVQQACTEAGMASTALTQVPQQAQQLALAHQAASAAPPAASANRILFLVVVSGADLDCLEDPKPTGPRYTRDSLRNLLQLLGCKPRLAFKVMQAVFTAVDQAVTTARQQRISRKTFQVCVCVCWCATTAAAPCRLGPSTCLHAATHLCADPGDRGLPQLQHSQQQLQLLTRAATSTPAV